MASDEYPTAFSVENMYKDVGIVQRLADSYNLNLPGMDNTRHVYDIAMESGLGNEDFSATFKAVKKNSEH
ncbi:MAG: NAD-binding protein [Brevinema sp.]